MKFQEGRLSGLHNFGSSLSNNVTTASGSTSSSQNYTDLSLSHLTSSWNQQQGGGQSIEHGGPGGPGGQDSRHVGGPGTNTPSISLSTAASHTIPQLSITSSTSSPPSNSPADGKYNIFQQNFSVKIGTVPRQVAWPIKIQCDSLILLPNCTVIG